MKTLFKILLTVTIVLIIISVINCKTIEYIYPTYNLPPEPKRVEQQAPQNEKETVELILYYQELVELWENWAEDIKNILENVINEN